MEVPTTNVSELSRGRMVIRILQIISPTFFWIRLQGSQNAFEKLREELNWKMNKYHKRFIFWPDQLQYGSLVAVKNNGKWERGIVALIEGNTVIVSLRDWGE